MADAHTPLDPDIRAALVREARERIQSEGLVAELGHLATAALVTIFVADAVPRTLLVGWLAVMVVAIVYRFTVRLRIRHRGYDAAARRAFQLTLGTVAVTWGVGSALFARWLPFDTVALLLVALCGLLAAATSTLATERLGFRVFLAGILVPPLVAIAVGELDRSRVTALLLIVVYGAVMWFLHERAHAALTDRLVATVGLERSEAKAAWERAQRDALFASAPVAIVVVDEKGLVRDANPQFESLMGWTAAESRGRPLNELVVPSGEASVAEQLDRTVRAGGRVVVEAKRRRKDGTLVTVRASAARVERAGGAGETGRAEVSGAVGEARDVFVMYEDMADELKARRALEEAKDAAERVAQMRSAFLANMSHEIRTPMNAVLGLTELLLDSVLTAEQRRSLALIQTAGESLLTLLNDILDLSKIEADSLKLETIPFDLWRLVDQIVSLLAVRAQAKGVEVASDIGASVPEQVRGDPTRLRQVLTNLIGNAVKFTERGQVVVSLAAEPAGDSRARVRFAVRDTGIGIPPEQLAHLFQPYSQGDATTARRFGGTGLGLAIARRLVGMMGGTVEVTSEVNKGSEFSFTIELPVETALPAPMPFAGAVPLDGLTMLVVDDNEANRKIARDMLGTAGVTVDEAADAEEGLAALRRAAAAGTPYPLAILDAQMPGRDGFEMAVMIRGDAQLQGTRLMMLTSAAQRGDAQRCRERGIHGYLAKPVSRSDLLDIVTGVLGAAESEGADFEVVTRHRIHESRRRLRILVADDSPVNQEVAATMLRKRGYEVDVVENGRLAVERVAGGERGATHYDLVLMDVEMPEMNGYEASEKIRTLPGCRDLAIVACTAHARPDERERCLSHGMNAYLSKPFKPFELFTTVEGWGSRAAPGAPARPSGAERPSGAQAPGGAQAPSAGGASAGTKPSAAPASEAARPPIAIEKFRQDMAAAGAGAAVDAIVASFRSTLAESRKEIAAAVAAGDTRALARQAHTCRSSAAQLGAEQLAALFTEMEDAARAERRGDLAEIHGRLEAEAAVVEDYLGKGET